jgi:hypothetical protein
MRRKPLLSFVRQKRFVPRAGALHMNVPGYFRNRPAFAVGGVESRNVHEFENGCPDLFSEKESAEPRPGGAGIQEPAQVMGLLGRVTIDEIEFVIRYD